MPRFPESIKKRLEQSGVDMSKLTIVDDIYEDKQNSYWYGGSVAEIKHNDLILTIEAIGDVRVWLYNRKTDEQIAYVKDKNNAGVFNALSRHIKNDKELNIILMGEHPKYYMVVDNNNWWECFAYHGEDFYDMMWDLDADTITEAIEEVWEAREDIYDYVTEKRLG